MQDSGGRNLYLRKSNKTIKSSKILDNIKLTSEQLVGNLHEHYLPPIIDKKEWLKIPKLNGKKISLPNMQTFEIDKQKTIDSCGLCSGEMVINDILKNKWNKKISEKNIMEKTLIPQIWLVKEYVGITPEQLQNALQEILIDYHLPYTATRKDFISYKEVKNFLEIWSYLIFSYMWDAIDNPHRTKNGKKDLILKNIHHPHYIVLLGIDEKRKIVTIANPFGYKEKIDFKQFWQRISLYPQYLHSNKLYLPLVESGIYMPRTCIIILPNS